MKPLAAAFALAMASCDPQASEPKRADRQLGERAYQKCYSCHELETRRNDLTGPTLHRIVGRRVAAEDFDYSPALKRFAEREPRWTRELLDRFISDPEAVVPGTSMAFHGIENAEERKALIAFLGHQTKANTANFP